MTVLLDKCLTFIQVFDGETLQVPIFLTIKFDIINYVPLLGFQVFVYGYNLPLKYL